MIMSLTVMEDSVKIILQMMLKENHNMVVEEQLLRKSLLQEE